MRNHFLHISQILEGNYFGAKLLQASRNIKSIAAGPLRSANKGLPLPLGRGVCETKSRKPFISRVFCAQRGIETMVPDHGLGRGQTMG